MHRPLPHVRCLTALAAIVLFAGCGGGNDATAPRYQPQVTNAANTFGFQVTGLESVSDNLQYTWRNDGTVANVDQSPSGLLGTATLIALDASGTQVYSRSLGESGSFTTAAGTAGNWTLRVRFSRASGSANFRLQRP